LRERRYPTLLKNRVKISKRPSIESTKEMESKGNILVMSKEHFLLSEKGKVIFFSLWASRKILMKQIFSFWKIFLWSHSDDWRELRKIFLWEFFFENFILNKKIFSDSKKFLWKVYSGCNLLYLLSTSSIIFPLLVLSHTKFFSPQYLLNKTRVFQIRNSFPKPPQLWFKI